jgi:transposase, IS5 family
MKLESAPVCLLQSVMKTDGHLGRCHLKGNVVLSAVGHNLRLVLAWLRILPRFILLTLWRAFAAAPAIKWAS